MSPSLLATASRAPSGLAKQGGQRGRLKRGGQKGGQKGRLKRAGQKGQSKRALKKGRSKRSKSVVKKGAFKAWSKRPSGQTSVEGPGGPARVFLSVVSESFIRVFHPSCSSESFIRVVYPDRTFNHSESFIRVVCPTHDTHSPFSVGAEHP